MTLTLEDELDDIIQNSRDGKPWSQKYLAEASGLKMKPR